MSSGDRKSLRNVFTIRRPTQVRGRRKFEAILDAVEGLLEDREPEEISIYDIARIMEASPPSIYHFFPEISLVYVALAERYLEMFGSLEFGVRGEVSSWAQVVDAAFSRVRAVYEERAPVRKVLLGGAYSPEVRRRDVGAYPIFAQMIVDEIGKHFELPSLANLPQRIEEMITISDALWMLSFYRSGSLTDEGEANASRARVAYLRLYLPEMLSPRG